MMIGMHYTAMKEQKNRARAQAREIMPKRGHEVMMIGMHF